MTSTRETKAQRIFKATRRECKSHIKAWGKPESGFSRLVADDEADERMSNRTFNEIEKIIESAEKDLALDIELGVSTKERNEMESQTLWMVRQTLENSRRNYNNI